MIGTSPISSAATIDGRTDVARAVDRRRRAGERLRKHAALWRDRPLTQAIYRRYHEEIIRHLSAVAGADLEVGAGHGSFAEFARDVISCDIVTCPWLDCAADASQMPFRDASLSNIIMIDVLHHLSDPTEFLAGAARTLAPGGRVLLIEPYVSPVSYIAWRFFHDEDIDMNIDPLTPSASGRSSDDPWEANIALPTLIFWWNVAAFRRRFPAFKIEYRRRFDLLLYPLSGGFERKRLVPLPLVPLVSAMERLLTPLASLLAFRCMVVLERV